MRFSVKANTYIFLAILLFIIPLRWTTSWLFAVAFHEFCHWLAVRLCGGEVYRLEIGLGGADMQCSNMSDGCRLFAILCGPIGGFLLAGMGRWFPRTALCSFFLSLYNLLPLLPLDGGRALHILFRENRWICVFEKIFLVLILLLGFFCTFWLKLGAWPLAFAAILYLRNRKIPCKWVAYKVQ